jgi:hypothetical protein
MFGLLEGSQVVTLQVTDDGLGAQLATIAILQETGFSFHAPTFSLLTSTCRPTRRVRCRNRCKSGTLPLGAAAKISIEIIALIPRGCRLKTNVQIGWKILLGRPGRGIVEECYRNRT